MRRRNPDAPPPVEDLADASGGGTVTDETSGIRTGGRSRPDSGRSRDSGWMTQLRRYCSDKRCMAHPTKTDSPRRLGDENKTRACRRCGVLRAHDLAVASQLDLLNAPDLTMEAACGMFDLLGISRLGTSLERAEGLRGATREDFLRCALDHATAHLDGYCSIRCWGKSRHPCR